MRHVNYIHYNPVKHGYAECPHGWPYSMFHRWQREGFYREDWLCSCRGAVIELGNELVRMDEVGE